MKTITIRNIPDELAQRIEERAKQTGMSLSQTVIQMVRESFPEPRVVPHNHFDKFFGTWTEEQADEFDAILAEMRGVDPSHFRYSPE